MEERKKQILIGRLTEYNETVNNISKFQLNKREENLFCDIMQQFAEEYHNEQLRQYNVGRQSELLLAFAKYVMPDNYTPLALNNIVKTFLEERK